MKTTIKWSLVMGCLIFANGLTIAQYKENIPLKDLLLGKWEVQGTIMGEDGNGWVVPHSHSNKECGLDHSEFNEDHTVTEVTYTSDCETKERVFEWSIEDEDTLTLSSGDRSINWHILSIEDTIMKVGLQLNPYSERRMYVSYKKMQE
ncbi:lipocalin family protein [Arenibacter amylolyticus]|uniref:lipocalin family protein n=1 Tax=Arenibacter amylolyticus TaxID=1406873 RepID=UPI000A367D62|nr:lipocalin family protein [Arenibacter amylolyticus]